MGGSILSRSVHSDFRHLSFACKHWGMDRSLFSDTNSLRLYPGGAALVYLKLSEKLAAFLASAGSDFCGGIHGLYPYRATDEYFISAVY